jgi:uncharacterized membrane protein
MKGEKKGSLHTIKNKFIQKIILSLDFFIAGDILRSFWTLSQTQIITDSNN